ncbi:Niemann-Pick C1 protein [Nymphaea thermarum]|nr:Niemann-Pick C1 protein [Nymphaea thermarum]
MVRLRVHSMALLLLKGLFLASVVAAELLHSRLLAESNASTTSTQKHAKEYCSMYGICAYRSDGKALNCPNSTSAVKPDALLSSKIQSLCPTLSGNVCCTSSQFDTLHGQVQQAVPFLVGCPACLRNFLNIFCELACSPNQSLFINVTSIAKVKWFTFLGRRAEPGSLGSPYSMRFQSMSSPASGMEPMNVSVYSCGDTSLGCSCGDCPSSPVCSQLEPPAPHEKGSCSVKIGTLKVKCVELSLAIIYVILVLSFFVWGYCQRIQRRRIASAQVKLMKVDDDSVHHSRNKHEEATHPIQAVEENPHFLRKLKLPLVQGYISCFYRQYGYFVARHPIRVLSLSILVTLLLCLGLIRFKVETRPEKLWVSHGSKAAEEKRYFDSHLAPFYRIEQLILATTPSSSGIIQSIVTDKNIQLLFEIQKKVDSLQVNYSGTTVSLTDICLKPLGKNCATQSVLQYFQMDAQKYRDSGVDHAFYCFQHYTSAQTCLSAFQGPVDPSTILGGFRANNYSEATTFVVTYPVRNAADTTGTENDKAVLWEKAFINLVKEELVTLVSSHNLSLSFSSESSVQEELKRESAADAITILISYLVMFAYISVTLGDAPQLSSCIVSSKVLLGLSGVVVVMLSVLGSIGFFSALGVKSTLIIMEVIPFLVLAVGVDNMCILVHAVKRQRKELPMEERLSNALVEVGPSITLASLSEVLAFAVGSIISMPACRVFSMFAALAVLLDFILQITAFTALIVLDFSRAEDHRIDCFPCIKLHSNSGSNKDSNLREPGLLERYMNEIHAPLLNHMVVKIIILIVFIGFSFASIALCSRIQPGLEQQIVLPRDSYLQGYFNAVADYLKVGPPLYFVVKNYNYSLGAQDTNKLCSISQCNSNSLLNEIAKAALTPESSYIAKPAASWLDDFLVWISPEAFGCCRKFTNGSYCPPDDQASHCAFMKCLLIYPPCCPSGSGSCGISGACKDCTTCFLNSELARGRPSTAQFKEKLPWFLNALPSSDCAKGGRGAYSNSVDLEGYENGIIQASEFRTYHTPLNKQVDYVNSMRAAKKFASVVSDSLKIEVFPYSVFYIFFEQYLNIWKTALINICIALGTVFIVCLVITSSLWISTIIVLVLAMIVLDIMGVMALLGIQLNAVSVVNLVMSVGIAVEFCVHITHAFVSSHGDKAERMREALRTMGASVFSGITLTKLVGVIVLRFARSEIFVVYYFQMYLALVLIGFLHGLVFLPVVLSICGPPSRHKVVELSQPSTSTASSS